MESTLYPNNNLEPDSPYRSEESQPVELDEEDLLLQKLRAEKEAKKTKVWSEWERARRIPRFDAATDKDGYITYGKLTKKLSELEVVIELFFRKFNPVQDRFVEATANRPVTGNLPELSLALDKLEQAIGAREVARHALKGMALDAKKKRKGWTKKTVAESKRQRELLVFYKEVVAKVNEFPIKMKRIEKDVDAAIRLLREEPIS
ncbi:hypothetical protein MCOR25_000372 [Pyricularia grisea]|uniref:Uncharacterized protein n=1 Tax=Pyricularia grisea TaxID=148305 RepID=A0A6P8AVI3_PYRGI|nr:uncharacterized protein PgNI_08919 [Pyricularia grisea]KAI6382856.1 hypothetical protein MCOR25_000372 [Pyricularia grisea]TLD06236.1 hypothetical protein PgNI_08919 [Pyricularia grisea]